jgi:hypothetical protein
MPMPTEPEGTPLPLSEVPLAELIARARRVADNEALMAERAQLVRELRRRGLSWRQIQQETGFPHSSARRWFNRS